jgi:TIGR03009 family protein
MIAMRSFVLSSAAVLALAALAPAQQPGDGSRIIPNPGSGQGAGAKLGAPGDAKLDPTNRLDALLMRWESEMKSVPSVYVKKLQRTDKETGSQKPRVMEGEARYLKPNLAALRLVQVDDPRFYELMVCTGQFMYEFRPQFKKLVIHEMESRVSGFDNNLLSFLFGMSAAEAKRRYELTLAKDITDQNPHWVYIDIKPRFEADKREFTRAQLVLFAQNMLPRRLWFEHPNSSEVTWDLKEVDTSVELKPMDFRPPDAPKGWDTQRIPLERAPAQSNNNGRPPIYRTGSDK